MLSNEQPPNTATCEGYMEKLVQMQARQLGHKLITGERNPNPMPERNAPNPAHGVHIRCPYESLPRVTVSKECQDHNDLVAGLGSPKQFQHLWGKHE